MHTTTTPAAIPVLSPLLADLLDAAAPSPVPAQAAPAPASTRNGRPVERFAAKHGATKPELFVSLINACSNGCAVAEAEIANILRAALDTDSPLPA